MLCIGGIIGTDELAIGHEDYSEETIDEVYETLHYYKIHIIDWYIALYYAGAAELVFKLINMLVAFPFVMLLILEIVLGKHFINNINGFWEKVIGIIRSSELVNIPLIAIEVLI